MTLNFKNKTILVTGATGSFGRAFVNHILSKHNDIKKIIIFSRDELKQFQMQNEIEKKCLNKLRFFLGDIRDKDRLNRAFENVDIVVHAAALKQVPAAEYNPIEFIKTNIIGAQNIIEASIEQNIKKVIALSTDKAAAPLNLYGATKLCSDKLFIAANNYSGKNIFSVCRYGNVMGTRGSVIPLFFQQAKKGLITITDKNMTRFNITLDESIDLVLYALENSLGNEIFIPKIPSYRIMDLAKSIGEKCKIKILGIRPGEKIHEEMITVNDSYNTIENSKYYIILPYFKNARINKYLKYYDAKKINKPFSYNSEDNKKFLTIKEIKKLIQKNISL